MTTHCKNKYCLHLKLTRQTTDNDTAAQNKHIANTKHKIQFCR